MIFFVFVILEFYSNNVQRCTEVGGEVGGEVVGEVG